MQRNALAVLCKTPHPETIKFYESLSPYYQIYLFVDDYKCVLPQSDKLTVITYPPLPALPDTKITRQETEPERHKYYGCVSYCPKRSCSRDCALYYFALVNKSHHHVWMLEDDVFFVGARTLVSLDTKYLLEDLLSGPVFTYTDYVPPNYNVYSVPPPYNRSMIAAVRCSRRFMDCLAKYTEEHGLIYNEFLFNKVAGQYQLTVAYPSEFDTVRFARNWSGSVFCADNLYHPVKDQERQVQYRLSATRPGRVSMAATMKMAHLLSGPKETPRHTPA